MKKTKTTNVAVLASGNGTNFEVLTKAINRKRFTTAKIKLLISDVEKSFVRKRAKRLRVKDIFLNPKKFSSRREYDEFLVKILKEEKIGLVVLAGYMRIVSPYFIKSFKNRILNVHPALLPAFKGKNSIKRALSYGCKITGVTVHFVDEMVDNGPIVLQQSLRINEGESFKELESAVHSLEYKLLPQAVKLFVEKRLKVNNRNRCVKII
ncbi:MAG: phosphoribosylglycinamide formyltransferase [Candidatus Omnitrophica bacterium]|nr:phosphoribosylglycinamide formyltransferase [Candidatus Omnitrophota bacterium]MDD5429765.1 phosphoribosylglycinamide formyltransferase [Candidatus Omnitrophota bacterium]